jgi:hypothetical protein
MPEDPASNEPGRQECNTASDNETNPLGSKCLDPLRDAAGDVK